jgi:Na+:H+ antiporter, NhaA family
VPTAQPTPSERPRAAARVAENFAEFMHEETSGALVLLAATIVALAIANSPAWQWYEHLLHIDAGAFIGQFKFDQSLKHWVDDALMAIFFFVVGLEIKREFIVGELSTLRGAALPVIAAIGGMVVPAALYFAINAGGPAAHGWGVPMATDIAFALGVLALLGSRVPEGLKVFLAALAITDDIGAIIVIAVFYTSKVSGAWLLVALIPLAILVLMNRIGVDEPVAYLAIASVLWFCVLNSGIHATIAGVIAAFTIPVTAKLSPSQFIEVCHISTEKIADIDVPGAHTLEDDRQQKLALKLRRAATLSTTPLQRLEFMLHPVAAFVILPLFALVNANIHLLGERVSIGAVGIGVIVGLVVGKPLGIAVASWIAVKLGFADLPAGVTWRHVLGAGMLGGIGFTMSLFVANLAFRGADTITEAKLAILIASVIAGLLGWAWLRYGVAPPPSAE